MSRAPWDRLLWGVHFSSPFGDKEGMLISASWDSSVRHSRLYPGEPSRALLFCTREQARTWCKAQMAKYRGRTDCCKDWRFRPVRVRERVTL